MEKLKTTKYSELMAKKFPANVWLVDRLMPEHALSVIAGYPSSFKTWILLDLIICLATGDKFLGEFDVKKNKVLLIDEESGERMLQDRIRKLTKERSLDDDLNIEIMSYGNFKLSNSDKIIKYCLENGIGVVIMDSLVRIHSNEENSSTEMSKLYDEFKKFKNNNLSVIFAHHNKKTGRNQSNPTEDMRGSSEIIASVDSGISLKMDKDRNEIKITHIKCRVAEELKPFNVEINEDEDKKSITFKYAGSSESKTKLSKPELAKEMITVLLGQEDNIEMYQKEIIDSLKNKVGESAIKEALKIMTNDGFIEFRRGDGNAQYYSLKDSGESFTS